MKAFKQMFSQPSVESNQSAQSYSDNPEVIVKQTSQPKQKPILKTRKPKTKKRSQSSKSKTRKKVRFDSK
jgi:hypothetical protein